MNATEDLADLDAARTAWLDAAVTYSQSAARINDAVRGGQRPTADELQRTEAAKADLAATRARYVQLGGTR